MRGDITSAVYGIVQANAGNRITLDDFITQTNLDRRQIQGALAAIIREGKWPIASIVRGRIWHIGINPNTSMNPETVPAPAPVVTAESVGVGLAPALPRADPERVKVLADEQLLARNRAAHLTTVKPAPRPAMDPAVVSALADADRVYEWMGNRPDGTVLLRDDLGHWHVFKEIEKL